MPKEPDIKPEDFSYISNAFQVIGQVHELPDAFRGFTEITRDEQTGRLTVQYSGEERLTPGQILDSLKAIPSYVAETRTATSENIELVAALGMRALEGLIYEQANHKKEYSKTALLGLQRALRNISQKTAIAFLPSDLPRREVAHGLASLNGIVNPNPRLKKEPVVIEDPRAYIKEKGILE
jgi:hypothetical protein